MAKVIGTDWPGRAPREAKYDWAALTNGQVWLLEPGTDFSCSLEGMVAQVHIAAKAAGKKARTRRVEGGALQIQAYTPEV